MSGTEIEEEPSGATTHPTGGAGTGPKRDVDDRALSTYQAAAALNVPYRTFMAAMHRGEIGSVKVGRYYVVPVEEIDRLLKPAIKTDAA